MKHMSIKLKQAMGFILALVCIPFFLETASAEADFESSNAGPSLYEDLAIMPQKINGIEEMIKRFVGVPKEDYALSQESVSGFETEVLVETAGNEAFEVVICSSFGYFELRKSHQIPVSYRAEGEGRYLPLPSKIEGKYTQDEAEQLALDFLKEVIGMDISSLHVDLIVPEDAAKERSRAYRFTFGYQYEGLWLADIGIGTQRYIEVDITDEGIVYAEGSALALDKGNDISSEAILTVAELKAKSNAVGIEYMDNLRLAYAATGLYKAQLVWLNCYGDYRAPDLVGNPISIYDGTAISE